MFKLVLFFLFQFVFIVRSSTKDSYCGKAVGSRYVELKERIVNGYDVGYLRYPWFAALIEKDQIQCGGSVIGPKTILTAAHCFKEQMPLAEKGSLKLEDVYTVRLGIYNSCRVENTTKEYKVEKVQIHELYKDHGGYFDICLLTLKEHTNFKPICLPSSVINKKPKEGTVPGMGALRFDGKSPCTQHEARILIYPDADCKKMLTDNKDENANKFENAFCAGYLSGGIDSCQGDSGGPLQILNENGDHVILGLVSFGYKCAKPNSLGVYTDVSKYINWIKEKSGLDAQKVNHMYIKPPHAVHHEIPVSHKPASTNKPHRRPALN